MGLVGGQEVYFGGYQDGPVHLVLGAALQSSVLVVGEWAKGWLELVGCWLQKEWRIIPSENAAGVGEDVKLHELRDSLTTDDHVGGEADHHRVLQGSQKCVSVGVVGGDRKVRLLGGSVPFHLAANEGSIWSCLQVEVGLVILLGGEAVVIEPVFSRVKSFFEQVDEVVAGEVWGWTGWEGGGELESGVQYATKRSREHPLAVGLEGEEGE